MRFEASRSMSFRGDLWDHRAQRCRQKHADPVHQPARSPAAIGRRPHRRRRCHRLPGAQLREVQAKHFGMVFQHFNLLTNRTAAGNVSFPMEIVGDA